MNFKKALSSILPKLGTLLVVLVALKSTSGMAADPLQSVIGAPVSEVFRLSSSTGKLEIADDQGRARLVYSPKPDASENSTLLAIMAPARHFLYSAADRISLEFRISRSGSLGVQWRADTPASQGYLLLINQLPGENGSARLYRTRMLPPSGRMADDMIASENIGHFNAKGWHRLEITTRVIGAGVEIAASITEIESGEEVAVIKQLDTEDPLENPGLLAFRFFLPPNGDDEGAGSVIEIRNLSVDPEMQ